MIEKRINNRCSNEDTFNKYKGFYKEALKESGYNYKLKYKTDPTTNTKRKKASYPNLERFNPSIAPTWPRRGATRHTTST